jgi:hypothetical protein
MNGSNGRNARLIPWKSQLRFGPIAASTPPATPSRRRPGKRLQRQSSKQVTKTNFLVRTTPDLWRVESATKDDCRVEHRGRFEADKTYVATPITGRPVRLQHGPSSADSRLLERLTPNTWDVCGSRDLTVSAALRHTRIEAASRPKIRKIDRHHSFFFISQCFPRRGRPS